MKLILQETEQDCLLACFAMVLDDYGIHRRPWELAKGREIGADGLSSAALKTLCDDFGLASKGTEVMVVRWKMGSKIFNTYVSCI